MIYAGEEFETDDLDHNEGEQVFKKIKVDDDVMEGEPVTNLEEIAEELVLEKDLQDSIEIQELELNMDDNIESQVPEIDEDNKDPPSVNTESYKKMTLTALKTLVLSRGIQVDMSKMKKNDLIKLLQ